MWNVIIILLICSVIAAFAVYKVKMAKVCKSAEVDRATAANAELKRRFKSSTIFLSKVATTSQKVLDNLYFAQNTLDTATVFSESSG